VTDRLLTHDDVEFYRAHGYLVAGPQLIDDERCARVQDVADEILTAGSAPLPFMRHRVPDPTRELREVENAWWCDDAVRSIVLDPQLGQAAADLMGCDEVYLWMDLLIWKPGGGDPALSTVGWHRDDTYWKSAAVHSTGAELITAWIALDDVDPDMGPLRFVDRATTSDDDQWEGYYLEQAGDEIDASRLSTAVMRTGHVSFHAGDTVHGSSPNTSTRRRLSISVHMIAGTARVRRGRGHFTALTDAPDGGRYTGAFFPRLWPPVSNAAPVIPDAFRAATRAVESGWGGFPKSAGSLAWLWLAGRDDPRPLEAHPDHPVNVLREFIRPASDKPSRYTDGALAFLAALPEEEWTGHRWSPALIAAEVLDHRDAISADVVDLARRLAAGR
jgi:hypothetical protein